MRKLKLSIITLSIVMIVFALNQTASGQSLIWAGVSHPEDVVFRMGETGQNITWQPVSDYHLHWRITRNDTEISSGTWEWGSIWVSLGALSMGAYEYEIVLWSDAICVDPEVPSCYMLYFTDDVIVVVLEPETILYQTLKNAWIVIIPVGMVGAFLLVLKRSRKNEQAPAISGG